MESYCYAPGISVFKNGMHYTHGGISPQECFIPYLVVKPTAQTEAFRILDVSWNNEVFGNVTLSGVHDGLKLDIRKDALDPNTSIAERFDPLKKVACAIFVNEGNQGASVEVVLLSEDGTLLHRFPTTIPTEN
jgi:hypothetical protein